jgi:hypothetical protein
MRRLRQISSRTLLRIVAAVVATIIVLTVAILWHRYRHHVGTIPSWLWEKYHLNRDDLAPLMTPIAALVAAWIALGQLRVARQRHEEQTKADRQRRITESYSKAVEQLASEKIEVRLGGIYTLERISKESPDGRSAVDTIRYLQRSSRQRSPMFPPRSRHFFVRKHAHKVVIIMHCQFLCRPWQMTQFWPLPLPLRDA